MGTHTHTPSFMQTGPEDVHKHTNLQTVHCGHTNTCHLVVQKTEGLRVFTFGGEIEHVVTAEWWERPEGVCDVQQRGTALSQGFSVTGGATQHQLSKRFF